jgi:hypothetical protein
MILYMRTERRLARRAALIGAALCIALAGWWLWDASSAPEGSKEAAVQVPTHAVEPARAQSAAPAAPGAAPVATAAPASLQYVGQWMNGGRRAVLFTSQGRNIVVHVPGPVDDRYEVLAADERQLVLRDRATAGTLEIALGSAPLASLVAPVPAMRDEAAPPLTMSPTPPQVATMVKPDLGDPD